METPNYNPASAIDEGEASLLAKKAISLDALENIAPVDNDPDFEGDVEHQSEGGK